MNRKNMQCAYWREGDRCALEKDGVDDFCVLGPCSRERPSNADLFRRASDKQLAAIFAEQTTISLFNEKNPWHRVWLKFLQEPADNATIKRFEEGEE